MMESYFAHSVKHGCPSQSYCEHIRQTEELALYFGSEMKLYCRRDAAQIENILRLLAVYHDLGKLDEKNQAVLHEEEGKRGHLPVNHADAGAAFLKQMGQDALCSLMLVYAHHRGLPDSISEAKRSEESCFRDNRRAVRNYVDQKSERMIQLHRCLIPVYSTHVPEHCEGDPSMFIRMIMSCLVDADHSDTASVYRKSLKIESVPKLEPKRRLEALNRYVESYANKEQTRLYKACRDCEQKAGIVSYDGFDEDGKNTAVMAYQLSQAISRKARRIFVVLPYIDRITQTVEVYRKALVMPGEKPEEVVAEIHCETDFKSEDTRCIAALWRAPIIVTTPLFFFETLASNRPGTLRRLHELPGSIVFAEGIQEALSLKLLPLVWRWIKILEEEWSCHWILASGSQARFWEIPELVGMEKKRVLKIINPDLLGNEKHKIPFFWRPQPLNRKELIDWVMERKGPQIIIMNTAQNAAVIARDICKKYGRECVEHLSSVLSPVDYKKTIETIKKRLLKSEDKNWVLVATSCVEAVTDLAFRIGFREIASVSSLLQAAEKIDKSDPCEEAEMWSFSMQDDVLLTSDPKTKTSAELLKEYLQERMEITPELSTRLIRDALQRGKLETKTMERLIEAEENLNFQTVNDLFHMVKGNTVPVIVNSSAADQFRYGSGNWRAVQKYSILLPRKNLKSWQAERITKDVYRWTLPYDSFLGCMAGVLDKIETELAEYRQNLKDRVK